MPMKLKQIKKKQCSILHKLKWQGKQVYYINKSQEYSKLSKQTWQFVNLLTNHCKNKWHVMEPIDVYNITYLISADIAKRFGDYFSSIGIKMASGIKKCMTNIKDYISKITNTSTSIFMYAWTQNEISKLIDKLPNKTSSGHDEINNILLKKLKRCLVKHLEMIFNDLILGGKVPNTMKLAEVVPLHKGKSKSILNNYRPISLLTTLSNILEKVVYKCIYNNMEKTNQLYKSQYGFWAKRTVSK